MLRGIIYAVLSVVAFAFAVAGMAMPYGAIDYKEQVELKISLWNVCYDKGWNREVNGNCYDSLNDKYGPYGSGDNVCNSGRNTIKAGRAFCLIAVLGTVVCFGVGLFDQFRGFRLTRKASRWILFALYCPILLCVLIGCCIQWNLYSGSHCGNTFSKSDGAESGSGRLVLFLTSGAIVAAGLTALLIPPKYYTQVTGVDQPAYVAQGAVVQPGAQPLFTDAADTTSGAYGQQQQQGTYYGDQQQQQQPYGNSGGGYGGYPSQEQQPFASQQQQQPYQGP